MDDLFKIFPDLPRPARPRPEGPRDWQARVSEVQRLIARRHRAFAAIRRAFQDVRPPAAPPRRRR